MKLINANRWGTAWMAVLLGIILVGCGGGGGDDDSDDGSQGATLAPESIGGSRVNYNSGNEGTRSITFNGDNASWTENRDGTEVSGSFQYRRIENGGSGELILSEGEEESRIIMTFNSQSSGSFVQMDQALSGTFEIQAANPDPGGGNEPPPNNGLAPSSLAGRTMYGTRTFTSTGPVGQTHVYTFSQSTFHDSDPPEESDGAFVYAANGNEASLTLNYQAPAGFDGDKHELQMTFRSSTAGDFTSVYTRRDGTVIRINGTFTLE